MPSWARVATRSRVPLGFLFAAAYLWFARPDWLSLAIGFVIAMAGVLVRALASGHIQKNAALATTGPYAYTRNPLYLGSIIIAIGFIVAARNVWIGVATLAMFAFIYLPVIKAEEIYLRSAFSGYDRYASAVPRLSLVSRDTDIWCGRRVTVLGCALFAPSRVQRRYRFRADAGRAYSENTGKTLIPSRDGLGLLIIFFLSPFARSALLFLSQCNVARPLLHLIFTHTISCGRTVVMVAPSITRRGLNITFR